MSRRRPGRRLAALAALVLTASAGADAADDRHAGYYYPIPATGEVYTARATTLPEADRTRRILFATELMNQMLANPYPPQFALFAKGEEGEKLVITSLYAGAFDTLYRMRGLLAIMSAQARATPIFREYEVEDLFTFFDLLKMLGFRQLTVTDGEHFAHRIDID